MKFSLASLKNIINKNKTMFVVIVGVAIIAYINYKNKEGMENNTPPVAGQTPNTSTAPNPSAPISPSPAPTPAPAPAPTTSTPVQLTPPNAQVATGNSQ